MNTDQRLAQIAGALSAAGVDALVMGGHAVRYYGVDRNTIDFDFYTGVVSTNDVRSRLNESQLLAGLREGPSWRPNDFTRFELGKLPDGREEWLEFWVHNHLLPDFQIVRDRAERGSYGGAELRFLSISDLMRSKETEREGDWRDIELLEEISDARNLATASDPESVKRLISHLRSRRGFERARAQGMFKDRAVIREAAALCQHPVSYAFVLPLLDGIVPAPALRWPIDKTLAEPLRIAPFSEPRHLMLVELVRRAYKRWAMETDRQDKQQRLTHR